MRNLSNTNTMINTSNNAVIYHRCPLSNAPIATFLFHIEDKLLNVSKYWATVSPLKAQNKFQEKYNKFDHRSRKNILRICFRGKFLSKLLS